MKPAPGHNQDSDALRGIRKKENMKHHRFMCPDRQLPGLNKGINKSAKASLDRV